jgi:large subunit ribosomal protein L30
MSKKKKQNKNMVRVTLVKSPIGYSVRQKGTVRALGLHRVLDAVVHVDSPSLRGMIAKISHLVEVEEVASEG